MFQVIISLLSDGKKSSDMKYEMLAGPVYTYSTGMRQHLYVNNPEIVKEMNQCMNLDLGKPSYVSKRLAPMLGNGILRSNGIVWSQQRKIVAPEFFSDKVKVIKPSFESKFRKMKNCFIP